MTLGLAVGGDVWPIGDAGTLHAFFSSISRNLEPAGWGSRFPVLMGELYDGALRPESVDRALHELTVARRELSALPATALVWDIDDPDARAPWDEALATLPNLSRCFYTSSGHDVFDMIGQALTRSRAVPGAGASIVAAPAAATA